MSTLFTKIINREIPASIVYETDKVIAFNDINPQAPVHVLVVPKKEIPTLNDIERKDCEYLMEMYDAVKQITKDLNVAEDGRWRSRFETGSGWSSMTRTGWPPPVPCRHLWSGSHQNRSRPSGLRRR